jgi:hypothetical protein
MNSRNRSVLSGLCGTGILVGLIGLSGCSEQGEISASKKEAESKRDAIQKSTQSGVPGKPSKAPGGRAR